MALRRPDSRISESVLASGKGESQMIGGDKALNIIETVLQYSTGDQTEVILTNKETNLTRFANNSIHQNVNEQDRGLLVRVLLGQKSGIASTNMISEDAIKDLVQRATEIARLSPEDPDFKSLPEPKPLPDVKGMDHDTASATPEDRAQAVGEMVLQAETQGLSGAGYFASGFRELVVGNSLGVRAYHVGSQCSALMVVLSDTSSGYATASAWQAQGLDHNAVAGKAVAKCLTGQNPQSIEPGDYEVVLEAEAAGELVGSLIMGFNSDAYWQGRSPFSERLGERVIGDQLTIRDDALNTEGLPVPFDFEGMPKEPLVLIDQGRLRNIVYDSYTAGKFEQETTGHALSPTNRGWSPIPSNIFVKPGERSVEEMIKSVKKGLLVTRLYYNRTINPVQAIITGMTRDGTFYIEDGEIKYPVKNLRYTQSALEALKGVEMVGSKSELSSNYGGAISVPALKISNFTFTGATEH